MYVLRYRFHSRNGLEPLCAQCNRLTPCAPPAAGSLYPRLELLAAIAGGPIEANSIVVSNPRLLMSSYGVLGRLLFIIHRVPGGLQTLSVSTVIMMPKAQFYERFPDYHTWLLSQVVRLTPPAKPDSDDPATEQDTKAEKPPGGPLNRDAGKQKAKKGTRVSKSRGEWESMESGRQTASKEMPRSTPTGTLEAMHGKLLEVRMLHVSGRVEDMSALVALSRE